MNASYFYLAGIIFTIFGYITFQIKQKKSKGKETKRDYSRIDLNREYMFKPNWNRIKIEWIFIIIVGFISFVYSFNDPTYDTFGSRVMFASFVIIALLSVWYVMFALFNKRKIIIDADKISTFSFFSKKPIDIIWENLETAEYVIQSEKIRLIENKPIECYSSIGLMHYRAKDQQAIMILFDANMAKMNKKLEFKYW